NWQFQHAKTAGEALQWMRSGGFSGATNFHHIAASGTLSLPNINWKPCNAGFQWWMLLQKQLSPHAPAARSLRPWPNFP
ncbi:hypothetical protein, partial [Xanthomonas oryzae]